MRLSIWVSLWGKYKSKLKTKSPKSALPLFPSPFFFSLSSKNRSLEFPKIAVHHSSRQHFTGFIGFRLLSLI